MEKTLGEKRVRVSFNVSGDDYIDEVKKAGAKLIDMINDSTLTKELNDVDFVEWKRLKDLSLTAIEEGTSWAVKAATI